MNLLSTQAIFEMVGETLAKLPDGRRGRNTTYEMADAAAGAFGVFFTQSPSFLSYQRDMERNKGQNNAASLFGVTKIPSDQQIRNLLDTVPPHALYEPFWTLHKRLEEAEYLSEHRAYADTYLIAMDGTYYYSSQAIHCQNCSVREKDGQVRYYHAAVTPVLVQPESNHVYPLEPEFISPQDGAAKQDCERNAAARWVERNGPHFEPWQATVMSDDLHCHQSFCSLLEEQQLNYILVCKPKSHPALYKEVELLAQVGGIGTHTYRRWHPGGSRRFHEEWRFRYANQVPIRASEDALLVNWCEVCIYREDTRKRIYFNTLISNFEINDQSVRPIVQSGRARCKVENENNNVLKNYGYHLEHNYGHGEYYLSAVLVTINLLAFLIHTILSQTNTIYVAVREELGTRKTFFDDIRALTRYLHFQSMQALFSFMATQLEIEFEPD